MRTINSQSTETRGLLARLRAISPNRPLTLDEAQVIAERQANVMLEWFGVNEPPIPFDLLAELRRIHVVFEVSPTSGSTHWTRDAWLIALKTDDAPVRQRFSLFHELKHIIDHPLRGVLYPPQRGWSAARKVERVADYFAACVLMPKRLVKRYFFEGLGDVDQLAELFEVSPEAMHHRLVDDLHIVDRPRTQYACRSASREYRVLPFVWRQRPSIASSSKRTELSS
jgi:Zn-dependent peptidase ImmA (M78 family)